MILDDNIRRRKRLLVDEAHPPTHIMSSLVMTMDRCFQGFLSVLDSFASSSKSRSSLRFSLAL